MKLLVAATFAASVLCTSGAAFAGPYSQAPLDSGSTPAAQDRDNVSLLRQNNITSTGATVPNPGASQSAGPTPLDHDIERMNDKIEHSICKGC